MLPFIVNQPSQSKMLNLKSLILWEFQYFNKEFYIDAVYFKTIEHYVITISKKIQHLNLKSNYENIVVLVNSTN
jgi:hypothetical protein